MKRIFILLFPIVLFACKPSGKEMYSELAANDTIRYAQGFRIESHSYYQLLQIMNPWQSGKVLHNYVLVPKDKKLPSNLPQGICIRTPLERTVAFSSVVCGMMNELQALSSLVGVAESQYIVIPEVQKACREGQITDVGMAGNPNIEQLMLLNAEVVLANPVNETGASSIEKLQIPVIPCLEWMENHPLGQAEWIRLFGLLFDKKAFADSLFLAIEQSYNDLRTLTASVNYRPTVMTEKKYNDFWYQPGGKSYFAHLIEAAGGDYVFKDNHKTGSLPYPFETVLDKAGKSDFWLFKYYSDKDLTYSQLAAEYDGYTWFEAYKNQKIYVCNTQKAAFYYHELPLHPDWILKDLIRIFHPELLPEHDLRYYKALATQTRSVVSDTR